METLKDSLITVGQGSGAIMLSMWDVIPDVIRIGILFATFIHIMIKINKELEDNDL